MKFTMSALFLCLGFVSQAYVPPDLNRKWVIEYHDDNGVEVDHPQLTLRQSGVRRPGRQNGHPRLLTSVSCLLTSAFLPPCALQ
jgi:hypothetical protein